MRCPKCGYISFDNVEVCGKCKKNIKGMSESLRGTVFQVQSPSFLLLQPRQMADGTADDILVAQSGNEEDYVDDDLEILIEESSESGEIAFGGGLPQPEMAGGAASASDGEGEEEDREIEIDFSRFEAAPEQISSRGGEEPAEDAGTERSFSLEMPESLADISDLAPPAKIRDAEKSVAAVAPEPATELDQLEFDFNLGLDDLDLSTAAASPAETELSLDDLDFSETLGQDSPKAADRITADMDEELNFELDLGGLSIHTDQLDSKR